MSFKNDIKELAERVKDDALDPDCSRADRVDALKVLTALYSVLYKGKKSSDEEDEGDTFGSFAQAIQGQTDKEPMNGDDAASVRSRRRDS
jgi:hypothetical protein